MTGAVGAENVRDDRLLGGRVRLLQPVSGYRAATDPVLLAAAVPAKPGETVLDLGCGAGAAALCLAARVPALRLAGLEIQHAYAALARENARLNGAGLEVIEGSVASPPRALRALTFDHAMMNPPFHPGSAPPSADPGRDLAHRETETPLGLWIACALARTRPGGTVTVVQRVERLPEILAALCGPAGSVAVLPLAAREGREARRAIVQARKGARGPFRLLAPLVLHRGPVHEADRDDFTEAATALLREGAPLPL